MDDEENNRDADAGIGHVECRPWMGEGHVQIEQKKIDYMPVKQTVRQVSKYTREQERERNVPPEISCPPKRFRTGCAAAVREAVIVRSANGCRFAC